MSKLNTKEYFVVVVVFMFMFVMTSYVFVLQHENVHKEIFRYYGCTNSSISISFSWTQLNGVTVCNEFDDNRSGKEVSLLNAMNDVMSYNMAIILDAVFIFNVMLYIFLSGGGKGS